MILPDHGFGLSLMRQRPRIATNRIIALHRLDAPIGYSLLFAKEALWK